MMPPIRIKRPIPAWCAVLLLLTAVSGREENVQYLFPEEATACRLTGWLTMGGDSAGWSAPGYDDSGWRRCPGAGLWVSDGMEAKGVRWYRKKIFFPEPPDTLRSLAVYQSAIIAANEIHWDGRLIAASGRVGDAAGEVPGMSGQFFIIPRALTTPGEHTVALRVSNHSFFSGFIESPLCLGYFSSLHTSFLRTSAVDLFLAGIFLFTALFHLALCRGNRNRWPYVLFSLFSAACCAYIIIYNMRKYFQIDLSQYYTLAAVNDVPWLIMMTLLPAFFMFEFSFPRKRIPVLVIFGIAVPAVLLPRLVIAGLIPSSWLETLHKINEVHIYATIVFSSAICVRAIRKRHAGGVAALLGCCTFLAGVSLSYGSGAENAWAVGFALLIVFLTVSLSRQMAQSSRQLQEVELRSARLEIELLKKHIQPHFLLNSLNSIVAWLEEEPATAAKLVTALADELRMLMTFASRPLVSLWEEVRLCRTHVEVMGLRHLKKFTFETRTVSSDLQVPPLIIHTMLENALTHGYARRDSGTFILTCEQKADRVTLTLFNDGRTAGGAQPRTEGTGLKYIRTRLEEQFPGRWEVRYGPVQDGWSISVDLWQPEKP